MCASPPAVLVLASTGKADERVHCTVLNLILTLHVMIS